MRHVYINYDPARASPNPQIWWARAKRLVFHKALCQAAVHLTSANANRAHNSRMVLRKSESIYSYILNKRNLRFATDR